MFKLVSHPEAMARRLLFSPLSRQPVPHPDEVSMTEDTRGSSSARAHEQGFSLIEVLVASVIFMFIALSIIPMFTMSASSNVQGQDNTKVANLARGHLDELWELPFADPLLTIPDGSDELVRNEYYDKATDSWKINSGTLPAGTLYWRVTTVRQYSVEDLATRVSAPADPSKVQIKEIIVEIHSTRAGGPLGGGKELTVSAYKSI
jgi:type II secretory pathway pseudopilin PulG